MRLLVDQRLVFPAGYTVRLEGPAMKFVIVIEGTHDDADLNHFYKGMAEYRNRLEANGFTVNGAVCSHEADYDKVVIAKLQDEKPEPSPIQAMLPPDGQVN